MELKAIYNAVVVKPVELDESSYGNIIIPDLGNDMNKLAEVITVGPGLYVAGVGFVPTELKPGDKVVLPTMGFTKFQFKNEEYWIGPENTVLAVVNTNDN